MTSWQDTSAATMMNTFGPTQALLVSGEGARVRDSDGKEYLDFLGGIAVNSLGHAHPAIVKTISEQAATLIHVSNFFSSPPQLALAEKLKRVSGVGETGRVFFTNSGTEANEAAFKLARKFGGEARPTILALEQAFHGRSMGALALTAKEAYRAPFAPLPGGVRHIPATIEALDTALDESVSALIIEPIQGEAGVIPLPEGYLQAARALTRERGALLIIDEIQTGIGRTGEWFGFQSEDILPDAFTLAKGLGGGFPIGALVTTGAASEVFTPGTHGTTFGGNPLATAVAGTVLDEIESGDLLINVREREAQLRGAIAGLNSPLIAGVRGRGLLLGIALTADIAPALAAEALAAGLIVNAPNAATIRIAPPLNITSADVDAFVAILDGLLAAHAA
ncbi:acetylornithine transaminase [Mycetocola sp. JXN-3]|uniref:acetylornithine transaminase n=1 Tax=Mycetocola sp. JXN-3 TaxID=2116510 RepID=UPI00165D2F3A|nr:acetylornithine transaminase [Mycetocola sp. JXN-3]